MPCFFIGSQIPAFLETREIRYTFYEYHYPVTGIHADRLNIKILRFKTL